MKCVKRQHKSFYSWRINGQMCFSELRWNDFVVKLPFLLHFQHSEEMYDSEIYRHQISEYYNPYVLDAEIQAGEFYSAGFEPATFFSRRDWNCEKPPNFLPPTQLTDMSPILPPLMSSFSS